MGNILYYLIGVSILGMAYSFWKYYQLTKLEAGDSESTKIATTIKKGAIRYIETEYKVLTLFVVSISLLLFFKGHIETESNSFVALSYFIGAAVSAFAGYLAVRISTYANLMATNEGRISFTKGYNTAISGSASAGLANAALLIVSLSILLLLYNIIGKQWSSTTMLNVLAGFALGGSSVSLFARFGGGLFAKSAEMADNQIQSSEPGIKSNSLYNPASYANDIGQTASNMNGIHADIFESFAGTLIASMLLGIGFLGNEGIMDRFSLGPVLVPLAIGAIGLLSSVGAIFLMSGTNSKDAKKWVDISEGVAALILVIAAFFITRLLLPAEWSISKENETEIITTTYYSLGIFWCTLFGFATSVAIGKISPILTNQKSGSIYLSATESIKGNDSGFLAGMQNGFLAVGLPVALVIIVSILSYRYAGFYGLGIAAVSMLGNMGFYATLSAFAPIADNSNTIAIKAGLTDDTIKNTSDLKLFGIKNLINSRNYITTAAALALITLFSAFIVSANIELVNLSKPLVITGILFGALLPFLLSSTTLSSVVRITKRMVREAKRQFTEITPLVEAKVILDKYKGDLTYATEGEKEIVKSSVDDVDACKLVEVSTYSTIWETIIPGGIAITATALLGYFAGIEILAGFLMGAVSSGILLSYFFVNSGNTWESTKIAFEEGIKINGEVQSTNSPGYQSSVTGDKTGKPMKDALAPAISVIVKLILITAIVLSSALVHRELSRKGLHVENRNKTEIHQIIHNI